MESASCHPSGIKTAEVAPRLMSSKAMKISDYIEVECPLNQRQFLIALRLSVL